MNEQEIMDGLYKGDSKIEAAAERELLAAIIKEIVDSNKESLLEIADFLCLFDE